MKKNYLVYPLKNMNITQSYLGKTSHLPHTTGTPKDYPIDEAGENAQREYLYCPCNKMKLKRIYGVRTAGTNTIWLQSTGKVYFADGTKDYFTLMVIHPNDDDLEKLREGQVFRRGDIICREGTDGYATGNHFHLSGGKGKFKDGGWCINSCGKWVLTVSNGAEKPEKLFYLDKSFTNVIDKGGLLFKTLSEKKKGNTQNETKAQTQTAENYIVDTELLYVRKGPGTEYDKVKYSEMTVSAQSQIKTLCGAQRDGYVMGVEFTALEIKGDWARTPSGWVCLIYCKKK